MSIVVENEFGWLLCSAEAIRRNYQKCLVLQDVEENDALKTGDEKLLNKTCRSYGFKDELFKIHSPFMMDTQFEKLTTAASSKSTEIIEEGCSSMPPAATQRKRKRKRSELNEGELKALEYHNEVKQTISLAYQTLVNAARELKYFQPTDFSPPDNNCEARMAATIEGPGDSWVLHCENIQSTGMADQNISYLSHKDSIPDCSRLVGRNVTYPEEEAAVLTIGQHNYLIPPKSSFLMSNLNYLEKFPHLAGGPFDLIVMDPPWQNKSVKRQKSYWSVTNADFLSCPVNCLAAPECIVVVWVTNRQTHQSFVKEKLFPKWNVQFEARWHWLKVTTSGKFVYDLDSPHKKPYEALLIGRYRSHKEAASHVGENKLPQEKVIISIPCSLHSKKPHLEEILSSYLICNPKCLELFARNLWPGWTSWGNEVLKHQHMDFFRLKEKSDNHVTHANVGQKP